LDKTNGIGVQLLHLVDSFLLGFALASFLLGFLLGPDLLGLQEAPTFCNFSSLNAFHLGVETFFFSCRALLDKFPRAILQKHSPRFLIKEGDSVEGSIA